MSSAKVLSSSALVHSASSLQKKREQLLGIESIKHWSELDAALQSANDKPRADLFAMHHSEPDAVLHNSQSIPVISFLDSDDDSSNGDVDYLVDEFENQEPLQRLHGTPLLVSKISPTIPKEFVDLSASSKKIIQVTKSHRKPTILQPDKAVSPLDDLVLYPNGNSGKAIASSTILKNSPYSPKQPVVVHRGLPSSKPCPDFSPISFKLLCANDMPGPVARAPLSGSPLKHPFRLARKKSPPSGNVEAAVQIFKVDVSPPGLPQMYDSKTFRINRMHTKMGTQHPTTTPAAPVTALQMIIPELPPLGVVRPHEYWGQAKPMEEASRSVTQPPRDYGLIIHLALNRPKHNPAESQSNR
jgi:hypothetical protein